MRSPEQGEKKLEQEGARSEREGEIGKSMVRWKRQIEELLGAMKEVKGWKENFRLIKKEVKEGISK